MSVNKLFFAVVTVGVLLSNIVNGQKSQTEGDVLEVRGDSAYLNYDYQKAFDLYREAAEKHNDKSSQVKLGNICMDNPIGVCNGEVMVKYYQLAAL